MIPIPPSTTHTSREKPSYVPGVGENILGVFSSVRPGSRGKYFGRFFCVRPGSRENILGVFLAVPRVVGENIYATLRLFRTPIYVRATARSRPSVSPKAEAKGGFPPPPGRYSILASLD